MYEIDESIDRQALIDYCKGSIKICLIEARPTSIPSVYGQEPGRREREGCRGTEVFLLFRLPGRRRISAGLSHVFAESCHDRKKTFGNFEVMIDHIMTFFFVRAFMQNAGTSALHSGLLTVNHGSACSFPKGVPALEYDTNITPGRWNRERQQFVLRRRKCLSIHPGLCCPPSLPLLWL